MSKRVTPADPTTAPRSGQAVSSTAPNVGAGLALGGVVVVSYFSMASFLGSVSIFGGGLDLADYEAQRTTGTVAIFLLVALIVIAAVSAAKGGTGARVAAAVAIVLGIMGVGVFGILASGAQESIYDLTPTPPAAAEPTCGPDYHPPFFGPGDTLRACADDAEEALAAAQHVVAGLTDAPVTVEALQQALSDSGLEQLDVHGDDGTGVRVVWGAALMACAVVTGDSTGWHAEATELLADGGCSDRPADAG